MRYLLSIGLLLLNTMLVPHAWAGSTNSLLDISPDGRWVLAVNPDNGTVSVIDDTSRTMVREIKIGQKPESVAWIGNGPQAVATSYETDELVFFDTSTGKVLSRLQVADEPYGIVVNKAGTRAWVTQEYPGSVSEIDVASHKLVREFKVGSFVRGLALSPDEQRLYVTEFYTGILHAVDLQAVDGPKVVDSWRGHKADNLCRSVAVHPRRPKAYLTHIRSRTEVADSNGSIFPQVSVCDLVPANNTKRRLSLAMDTYNGVRVVTNAWESALSPDGTRLYTIYAGTNDMNMSRVVDDDYYEIERIANVVNIGQNPRAIRFSPDGKKVYVYNAMDFNVTIHDANGMKKLATIKTCDPPKTPEWVRGKILFNSALRPMSSRQWIACFSCHPDGRHDGRVWQNPEGLRKTTALFGMANTHPLHWSADRDEVQDFEYTIRGRLMLGRGLLREPIKPKKGFEKTELEETLSGRSPDLDALAIYSNSFDFTLSPHAPAPGKLSAAAERGRQLFASDAVGCIKCHGGPYYTDSTLTKPFKLHDVGTGTQDPSEKMGPLYDTPTLLGVYRTAPYLHHGKAATLRDVLTTANVGDRHGKTSHLNQTQLDDLVEFLQALPYELPPAETPNAVKYRLQSPAVTKRE